MTKRSSSAWPWQHHVEHFLNNVPRSATAPQPPGGFRTAKLHVMQPNDENIDNADTAGPSRKSHDKEDSAAPPAPLLSTPPPASDEHFRSAADDGVEVCQLLASDAYSAHVLGDTLVPDSTHYTSWRHQSDTMHALAERNAPPQTAYLPHYLTQAEYTADVHALPDTVDPVPPPALQVDAKEVARARLQMTRDHLEEKIDKHA